MLFSFFYHFDRLPSIITEGNIEDLTKEKAELDDRISKQEISAVEVDRMNRKKKELEEDLESLEQRKEEVILILYFLPYFFELYFSIPIFFFQTARESYL